MKHDVHSIQLRKQRLIARDALKKADALPFKTDSSAKWAFISKTVNGCILIQIEHDELKGVTPQMLKWWFEHLGCVTTWNGADFSGPEVTLYHLWHHRDHGAITPLTDAPDGRKNMGFLEGADTRIDERWNEYHDHIHYPMHTTRLDEHEFTFTIVAGGKPAGHIKHSYEPVEGGCSFYAETMVGLNSAGGRLFNYMVLPLIYRQKSSEYWIHHNIEETGRTQDVLPVLYSNQDKVYLSRS